MKFALAVIIALVVVLSITVLAALRAGAKYDQAVEKSSERISQEIEKNGG
jgi:hypothetical protein